MKKAALGIVLFFSLFVAFGLAVAQTYSRADQLKIADNARRLVRDRYLTNLEVLTHYEANQPFEVLQSQLNGLLKDAFRNREVLVYNEFRPGSNAYTTVEEYVKDARIFSSGKPVTNTLTLDEARYRISRTQDGFSFVSLYVDKLTNGVGKQGKTFRFQNRVEFRIRFVFDPTLNAFHSFKIAGITKVDAWPPDVFVLKPGDLEQAEKNENDLFTTLTSITESLKKVLPAGSTRLVLDRFTYNRCGINDPLSDRIFATLHSCLQKQAAVAVVPSTQRTDSLLWIRGYYQEDLNNLQIVAEVFDARAKRILAKVESTALPLAWISGQNLRLKPEQYQQVMAVQDTLRQHFVAGATPLTVEIRTDRGRTGVEYWPGNQITIEARVNRPCHLRLVYVLADGTKTLLENDFEIRADQVNQYVRIAPDASFVCAEPFGTEYLLAYASQTAFCPIPTKPAPRLYLRQENGYGILVGSLAEMLKALRCTIAPNSVAEDRIQITTRTFSN
ncbi:DUF4384 domain-containing protein [Larkinella sp. GY13]|uniref:DUF4384 domain-containing protein n=1 Tax=Larkinella sp. GY13 TaxID=3453720 RepID=UPI003EEE7F77